MGQLIAHKHYVHPHLTKDGRWTYHPAWVTHEFAPYCPLYQCELCGLLASCRRVQHRNTQVYDAATDEWRSHQLCMSCWNKARAIADRRDHLDECRRLIRKIKEAIREQNKDHRRAARLPGGDDGRREERPSGG